MEDNSSNAIRAWLTRHNHTQAWLARQLGLRRATVSSWARGKSVPSPDTAHALIELTGGELTLADLYPRRVERARAPRPAVTPMARQSA